MKQQCRNSKRQLAFRFRSDAPGSARAASGKLTQIGTWRSLRFMFIQESGNTYAAFIPSSHQPAAAASRSPNDASINQADVPVQATSQASGQPQPQVQPGPDRSAVLSGLARRSSASIQTVALSGPPTYGPSLTELMNADLEPASDAFPLIDTSPSLSPTGAAADPVGMASATTTSSTGDAVPTALANADDDPDAGLTFWKAVGRGKLQRVNALLALPRLTSIKLHSEAPGRH